MAQAAAELQDALESGWKIGRLEVGEREPVSGAWPACVHAQLGVVGVRLDALALVRAPLAELYVEETGPEPLRAGEIVGGELDQREAVHRSSLWQQGPRPCRKVRWTRLGSASSPGFAGSWAS